MLENLKPDLKKAEEHFHNELAKLQVGRAHPALVEGITVLAYGSPQPLRNVASVTIMDAQTISIQPWDRSILRDISKGISDANLGLNPQDNGESILIKVPTLTEERRRDLVKMAGKMAEEAKIAIRNIRQDYMKKIDAAEKAKEISEDVVKDKKSELQKEIDATIATIETMFDHSNPLS